MAQNSKTMQEWDEWDRTRLRLAVEEVRASENLRFMLSTMLKDMGVGQPFPTGNALETAEQVGRYNSGLTLVNLLLDFDPLLYAHLQEETLLESIERQNSEGTQYAD